MAIDGGVTGLHDLQVVADRLKELGDKKLRRDFATQLRRLNEPTLAAVRESALSTLPRRGGLAQYVAESKLSTRVLLGGATAGVRISGRQTMQLRGLDAGRLRHPVWGHEDRWVGQSVRPGWFSRPIMRRRRVNIAAIEQAARDAAAFLDRGV